MLDMRGSVFLFKEDINKSRMTLIFFLEIYKENVIFETLKTVMKRKKVIMGVIATV